MQSDNLQSKKIKAKLRVNFILCPAGTDKVLKKNTLQDKEIILFYFQLLSSYFWGFIIASKSVW